jgi:hypothetical protein
MRGAAVESERCRDLICAVLDRLDSQAEIMAALLWKGARQQHRSASWRRLHPTIAFSLLWVWADRLASSIASVGVDTTKTAEIIRRSEPSDLTHAFRQEMYLAWFYDHAFNADKDCVRASLVGDMMVGLDLDQLPASLRSRILSSIGMESKGVWFPNLQLIFPRPGPDGMWVANDPIPAIAQCDAVSVLKVFTERQPDGYVRSLLEEAVTPESPFLVTGMLSAADLCAVTTETAAAVVDHIDNLLTDLADRADDQAYRHAQCIRAECLGVMGDRQEMAATIARIASTYAAKHGHRKTGYAIDPGQSPPHKDLTHLLEMVIAYARHLPGSPASNVAAMSDIAAQIPEMWAGARHGVIEFLDRSITMLETRAGLAVWPSLLRVRES